MGGREKQRQLGTAETNTVEKKLRIDLANVGMIGFTWREAHRLERVEKTTLMNKKD